MLLVKNSKFLLSLLFFEKGLDMYFYDVLYKWEGFLEYKNVIFTESKNLHFSKGVNPWFWSKTRNFFRVCFSLKNP